MKRFLKIILTISVIVLICLVVKLNILDFSVFNVDAQEFSNYTGYYFNELKSDEKAIYVKMDDSVKDMKNKVVLGSVDTEGLYDKIRRAITAYYYDNPDIYYLSNEYDVTTIDLKIAQFSTLKLNYIADSEQELELKNTELDNAIDRIIQSTITEDMTQFEKELALHDALVKKVTYYEYSDLQTIPMIKHTAYGALVQNEAVCDGYSKAFKLLLEKVGIESIIIGGSTQAELHAWNLVKLDDKYYHVDVTSNKLDYSKKHVIHAYFNLSDTQISKTHSIDDSFNMPKCDSQEYDYYNRMSYYISKEDNLYNKLSTIIREQKQSEILEIKIDGKYTDKRLIDTLYDLDFNGWYSDRKSGIEYTKIQDKYIFVK